PSRSFARLAPRSVRLPSPTRRSSDLVLYSAPVLVEMKGITSVVAFPTDTASNEPIQIVPQGDGDNTYIISGADTVNLPTEAVARSEEHTSELQSRFDIVCSLLIDNKE